MVKFAARPLKPSASETLLSTLDVPELTPRSSLACKLHAVDPRELLPLAPEVFKTPGETKDEQNLRYSAYEEARLQTYRLVQGERERILDNCKALVPTSPLRRPAAESSPLSTMRTSASTSRLSDVPVTIGKTFDMERERRVLEKMRARQKIDIELMLLNELRLTKMKEKERECSIVLRAEEARQQRERTQKARELASARVEHEKKLEAAEQKEMARIRRASALELARQADFARKREAESKAAAKEAASRREAENHRRKEERLRQEEEMLKQGQDEQARWTEETRRRDTERLQRREERRQQAVAENARERAHALELAAATMAAREEQLRELREHQEQRIEEEERRRDLAREDQRVDIDARKRAAKEKMRRAQLKRLERDHEMAESIRYLEEKEKRQAELVASGQAKKRHEVRSKALHRDLRLQTHLWRAELRLRRDDHERELVSQKIRMNAQRTSDMIHAREKSALRCERMRITASMRKEAFTHQMEGMQSSSGFALPREARIIVENEELREFMRRYDKLARQHGGKNVPKTAVARLVCEMELKGALHLKPSRGVESRSMPGSPAKRPESAPAQPSDMDALTCAVRPESAAQ